MENNNNISQQEKKRYKISFVTVLIFFALILPLIYLLLNKKNEELTPAVVFPQPQATTITLLEQAKQAVATAPNYDTYLNLSLQYYNAGMFDECIAACNQALTFNAQGDGAYNNLGVAYAAKGNYEKEIEYCEKAILINPNNQLAKNNIIWAKEQLKLTRKDSLKKEKN